MSTDKKKKIVKPVTLSEQAYAIIKDEIITNQIKPGDLLTEEQLSFSGMKRGIHLIRPM